MKTPEEIKKGLECCHRRNSCRGKCPYDGPSHGIDKCTTQLAGDALAYIQRFESRLAQAERERDAAVEDLREASFCGDCFHYAVAAEKEPCASCLQRGSEKPNWQWRGVCPENTKED